jgi:hypothetical protein
MDSFLLALEKDEGGVEAFRDAVRALNPANRNDDDLFTMKTWDVSAFGEPHLPVTVAALPDPEAFSAQRGLRILDMAIYMPGQGWAVPHELEQFTDTVMLAYRHERMINPNISRNYVYITVDQKRVEPQTTQRRPGYHSDAYETEETGDAVEGRTADNTYIVYDAIPTHFQPGPFPLVGVVDPEDCAAVLAYFDALSEGKPPVHYPLHTMVKLTPSTFTHRLSMKRTSQWIALSSRSPSVRSRTTWSATASTTRRGWTASRCSITQAGSGWGGTLFLATTATESSTGGGRTRRNSGACPCRTSISKRLPAG